jgi:hypothetical protein
VPLGIRLCPIAAKAHLDGLSTLLHPMSALMGWGIFLEAPWNEQVYLHVRPSRAITSPKPKSNQHIGRGRGTLAEGPEAPHPLLLSWMRI